MAKEKKAPIDEEVKVADEEIEDDTEILAMKEEVQKKIDAKKTDERTYTQKDMDDMANRLADKFSKNREDADEDFIDLLDPNAVKRKFIRIARLKNKEDQYKFVIALKDMNGDTYSDQPIYITNIKGPTEKDGMIPWATLIFDDGTEELYPYLSFMKRSVGVWAEVIEEKKTDISEKFGLVDVKTLDKEDWDMKNSGKKVLAKALKYRVIYVVKEIKQGRVLEITADVVNKVEAPYSDLKKFLEETK